MDIQEIASIIYAPQRWRMLKHIKPELEAKIAEVEAAGASAAYLKIRLASVNERLARGEIVDMSSMGID